jgi:hypothetical protein
MWALGISKRQQTLCLRKGTLVDKISDYPVQCFLAKAGQTGSSSLHNHPRFEAPYSDGQRKSFKTGHTTTGAGNDTPFWNIAGRGDLHHLIVRLSKNYH